MLFRSVRVTAGDDGLAPMRGFGHTNSSGAFGHNGAFGQIAWADPATGQTLREALAEPAFWLFALATSVYGLVSSGASLFNEDILKELGLWPQWRRRDGPAGEAVAVADDAQAPKTVAVSPAGARAPAAAVMSAAPSLPPQSLRLKASPGSGTATSRSIPLC